MEEKITLKFYDAPVGSIVKYYDHKFVVREDNACAAPHCGVCEFFYMPTGECNNVACLACERDDGRFVHFETIRNDGKTVFFEKARE